MFVYYWHVQVKYLLQQNKLLDFLVIIRTAPVFGSVGPGQVRVQAKPCRLHHRVICLHQETCFSLPTVCKWVLTTYHVQGRAKCFSLQKLGWASCWRVPLVSSFIGLYWIRYGDSKGWQRMKQDFRPNWYQSLHNPPSPWKVVPHPKGLRPLLFTNSSVGYFMSHKNQNSELKGCKTGVRFFALIRKD